MNQNMKTRGKTVFLTLFLVAGIFPAAVAQQAPVPKAMKSQETVNREFGKSEQEVTSAVVAIFQRGHFSKPKLSDESSRALFDEYFEALDPNKVYFTLEDIEEFSPWREVLDDLVLKGNIKFPFQVYERLLKRVRERIEYARERMKKPFDFTIDETISLVSSEKPWSTHKELDGIWNTRIKNQMLVEFLIREVAKREAAEGKDTATQSWLLKRPPEEAVLKRYENFYSSLDSNDTADVLENFMSTFTRSFDPHSSYMSWRTLEDFDITMRLSLQGIGATLTMDDGYTKVVSIVKGGPADKQGQLKPGDRIVAVGQGDEQAVDVVNMPLNKVVRRIRGKKGTKVRLTVIKSLDSMPREIAIIRGEVKLEDSAATGETKTIKDAKGVDRKLAYVYLPGFYADWDAMRRGDKNPRSASSDVRRLLDKQIAENKVEGIVLDLRGNGGGSLDEAIKLSGLFIPKGPVVLQREQNNRKKIHNDENPFSYDLPLVVMVDRTSASASEIFAGAIQDYKRGVIIGDKSTHGKGTVQTVWRLDRHPMLQKKKPGALKFTMAKFYRVTGHSTQKKGVVPDIIFPSFFDHMEVGEARLEHVMPWDEIEPVEFEVGVDVSKYLAKLKAVSIERVKSDTLTQELIGKIKEYGVRQKNKEISLNKDKRVARQKEDEKWSKIVTDVLFSRRTRNNGTDEEKKEPAFPDVYLTEGMRILIDLVDAQSNVTTK
jgi:carboxyl-terminal processing protease